MSSLPSSSRKKGKEMGKRGNGEGSITRRKDGRWMARYTIYTADGVERKTIYGKTRSEVAEALSKALSDRAGGLVFDAGSLTLGDYLTRWLEDSVKGNVRHRTYGNYRSHVRHHIVPALGRIKLKNLSPAHVQGLYRSKLDSGLSPASVRYIHAVLHRSLKQAVKWGLIPRNMAEAVDPPRPTRKEINPLSPEEARKLLEVARGDRLEALYVLAITCGLRQGELLGLKWGDLDLPNKNLRVARQLQRMRDGSGLSLVPTKADRGRNIHLSALAVEALDRHHQKQQTERERAAHLYRNLNLVFASGIGTLLDPSNVVNRSFKPLRQQAGVRPIRFHDMRHTCATLMLSQAVPAKVVQEMLGHANISMTIDTYSHVLPNMQERAAQAIDTVFK